MLMKIFIPLLFLLTFYGCSDPASVETHDYIPPWVPAKVNEYLDKFKYREIDVIKYEINNINYYNIYSPVSSCMFCELYDINGNKINPDQYIINELAKKSGSGVVIWTVRIVQL